MRAITVPEFGEASVLELSDIAEPVPGPGQLLVRVAGAGVGPWDAKARRGIFGSRKFPYVPGAELSGVVEALGEGVIGWAPGDRVYATCGSGGYAELAVVSADRAARPPSSLDLADAGAVPVGMGTALEGIDEHLKLSPGETVCIAGGAGGIGTFAVQIAKARGARVVATASPANHEFLRDIGADEALDYHGDWVTEASAVDAAFDCVGGQTWHQCISALRSGGRAVSILPNVSLETERQVALSSFSAALTGARLAEGTRLIDEGRVRPQIAARLALDDAATAHEMVETRHTRGKILLVA